MVPATVEPIFQEFKAKVGIYSVMNSEDLKKAISVIRTFFNTG